MELLPSHHRLSRLPPFISHWLGYRPSPPSPQSLPITTIWSFIGTFCGLALIQGVFQAHYFTQRAVPSIIASYGASAVLIYGSIDGPLAQPRSLIGGHFIGALIGVSIAKLFQFIPPDYYHDLQWLSASLAVSLALVIMQFTRTVHPPAGATALLAAANPAVMELSWYLLPIVLLSSTLALVVALLVNNIQRRYPVFWFTADAPLLVPPPQDEEISKIDTSRCEEDQSRNYTLNEEFSRHSSVLFAKR